MTIAFVLIVGGLAIAVYHNRIDYMRVAVVALGIWFLCFFVASGFAAEVRFASGGHIRVSERAGPSFQQLVNWLEARGYRINAGASRGYGKGTVRHSKHPAGDAMDLNQLWRNRVTRPFPAGTTEYAASLGILHGAVWRNGDTGHFEIMTPGTVYASRRGRRHGRVATIAHATVKQEYFTKEW